MVKMKTVYTDQIGEELWMENQPFVAKENFDEKTGWCYPIVVHCNTIRHIGNKTLEIRKWDKL